MKAPKKFSPTPPPPTFHPFLSPPGLSPFLEGYKIAVKNSSYLSDDQCSTVTSRILLRSRLEISANPKCTKDKYEDSSNIRSFIYSFTQTLPPVTANLTGKINYKYAKSGVYEPPQCHRDFVMTLLINKIAVFQPNIKLQT